MIVLKTTQAKILSVLQSVAGIVERRHTLPILANVHLHKVGTMIQFTTSDLEIQIQAPAELGGDNANFECTVNIRKMIDILRTMPADQIVSLESNEARLLLKGGKSKFTLQTIPAVDFPMIQETGKFSPAFSVPQKVLKNLLHQVSFAMAVNDTRYYLMGLLMDVDGNTLRLVGTDGHRLALTSASLDVQMPKQDVILPRKTVLELQRLLSDSDDNIKMQFSRNQAKFSFDGMEFVSKLIEGKFPDYQRIIPMDHPNKVTLGRVNFLNSLQRTAILVEEKFKGIELRLRNGNLQIMTVGGREEQAEDEIEVDYAGEDVKVGFNVHYLTDVLSNMGQDMVTVNLKDENAAALIKIPGNNEFHYVVMPMRM